MSLAEMSSSDRAPELLPGLKDEARAPRTWMEARFSSEVSAVVDEALRATVTVFRNVWSRDAPGTAWEDDIFSHIQKIQDGLVVHIQRVFSGVSTELLEENEALRAQLQQLEDVMQKKAAQLEQELEARVGRLSKDMEQLDKELRSIGGTSEKSPKQGEEDAAPSSESHGS